MKWIQKCAIAIALMGIGCSEAHTPEPIEPVDCCYIDTLGRDAGEEPAADAGMPDQDSGPALADSGAGGYIEPSAACAELADALTGCGIACPFAGERCHPARVAFCVELTTEQGDTCTNLEAITTSPECVEACE